MNRDEKMGAFVTNKWLVGVLVALLMSMGGYIFRDIGREQVSANERVDNLDAQVQLLKIQAARNEAQYNEIIRRLDRIEESQDRENRPRRRAEAP